ncbi:MAG: Crp/Fnr family transcriptional regulator, partial [Pseudomonadota bacterium]
NKGWVISSIQSLDGHKTVIDVHHPGDIVGVSQVAYKNSPYSSYTASNAILCPFPRHHLDDLLKTSPRLSGMLQAVCMVEQTILHDRIAMMSSNEAHIRLCHFLLQTFCRLKFMNDDLENQFFCPLNQNAIGDAIGVTSVHVSRMFTRLSEMGLVERHRNFIKFLDWDKAVEMTGFIDRYAELDLQWLPEV